MLPGKATPLSILAAGQAPQKDIIPGFVRAAETVSPKLYSPPKIPASYQPHHDFPDDALPGSLAGLVTCCNTSQKNTLGQCPGSLEAGKEAGRHNKGDK